MNRRGRAIGHFFRYSANHSKTVRCQSTLFCGLRIQYPSSGKISIFAPPDLDMRAAIAQCRDELLDRPRSGPQTSDRSRGVDPRGFGGQKFVEDHGALRRRGDHAVVRANDNTRAIAGRRQGDGSKQRTGNSARAIRSQVSGGEMRWDSPRYRRFNPIWIESYPWWWS